MAPNLSRPPASSLRREEVLTIVRPAPHPSELTRPLIPVPPKPDSLDSNNSSPPPGSTVKRSLTDADTPFPSAPPSAHSSSSTAVGVVFAVLIVLSLAILGALYYRRRWRSRYYRGSRLITYDEKGRKRGPMFTIERFMKVSSVANEPVEIPSLPATRNLDPAHPDYEDPYYYISRPIMNASASMPGLKAPPRPARPPRPPPLDLSEDSLNYSYFSQSTTSPPGLDHEEEEETEEESDVHYSYNSRNSSPPQVDLGERDSIYKLYARSPVRDTIASFQTRENFKSGMSPEQWWDVIIQDMDEDSQSTDNETEHERHQGWYDRAGLSTYLTLPKPAAVHDTAPSYRSQVRSVEWNVGGGPPYPTPAYFPGSENRL